MVRELVTESREDFGGDEELIKETKSYMI